jgi:hypothetical protein
MSGSALHSSTLAAARHRGPRKSDAYRGADIMLV